jgi:hypothetical protein
MFSGVMSTRQLTDISSGRRSLRTCADRDAANLRPMSFSARKLLLSLSDFQPLAFADDC